MGEASATLAPFSAEDHDAIESDHVPATIQERAWLSPIWYTPVVKK